MMVALPMTVDWQKAHGLTERQREVLAGIARGKTMKEIGVEWGTSSKAPEFHRAKLMQKVGFFCVADLTRFAVRAGVVEL